MCVRARFILHQYYHVDNLRLISSDGLRQTTLSTGCTLSAGRLEIVINNQWGTVCSNGFDINAANIACRQLNYIKAVSFSNALSARYVGSCTESGY